MLRVVGAVLGTLLLVARVSILGVLLLAIVLCAGYALSWRIRHGGFPDHSLAALFPGAYEYLLPPRYLVLNTLFIFCLRLPLIAFLGGLFVLAVLLDRLWQALLRRVQAVLRADRAI